MGLIAVTGCFCWRMFYAQISEYTDRLTRLNGALLQRDKMLDKDDVGRAFSRVCLFVRTLKGKRLELSTPNLVHVYSIAVARHALTQRSKD